MAMYMVAFLFADNKAMEQNGGQYDGNMKRTTMNC